LTVADCGNLKSAEKSENKFGGLVKKRYLCIGNTEVTKTLLIGKGNN